MIDACMIVKNELVNISGINTVQVGIEAQMKPSDYPIIRIVPTKEFPAEYSSIKDGVDFMIVLGIINKTPLNDYEVTYRELSGYADSVKGALQNSVNGNFRWKDTIHDNDEFQSYKRLIMNFEYRG